MKTDLYKYKTEPFAHQVEAVKFVSEHPFEFCLFMEQGTGKTKTTIDIVENLFLAGAIKQVLIIAPNGVHRQWGKDYVSPKDMGEIVAHGFAPSTRFVWQSNKKNVAKLMNWMQGEPDKLHYLCVNVEAFSGHTYVSTFRQFLMYAKTYIIVDEATSIKNPDANRTDNIIHGLSECHFIGKRLRDYEPYSLGRAILTGTPEAKGPYGLWSMLEFVHKDFWGMNYYAFKARYGIERQVYFPGMLRPVRKSLAPEDFRAIRMKHEDEKMSASEIAIELGMSEGDVQYIIDNPAINTPYKNLNELRAKLATIAFTVRKQDCLDLPEKVYEIVEVPMNEEQLRLYKEIKKTAYALYEDHALDAANQVSIRLRLRQIAGGFFPAKYDLSEGVEQELEHTTGMPIGTPPKAVALAERLENHPESLPAIVACAFTAEVYWLADYLKKKDYKVGVITGKVSKNDRAKIEDAFKAGELDVLVAQTSTIAKGYNFQISSTIYIYSNTYATEDRMQLEDRIHRYGQTRTCTYVDLIAQDAPVDRHVLDVIQGDTQFQEYMRSTDPTDFLKVI